VSLHHEEVEDLRCVCGSFICALHNTKNNRGGV
jgi:hypothetical protein